MLTSSVGNGHNSFIFNQAGGFARGFKPRPWREQAQNGTPRVAGIRLPRTAAGDPNERPPEPGLAFILNSK
jgi:hypothetical protein